MRYDKIGIEQIRQEIDRTSLKLDAEKKKERPKETADDWHYYQDKRDIAALMVKLSSLKAELKNATVVKCHKAADRVDIGDVVGIYDESIKDTYEVRLTGKFIVPMDAEPEEISLNCPLGEAIYGKKAGERASFSVSGREKSIAITSITKAITKEGTDGRPDEGM